MSKPYEHVSIINLLEFKTTDGDEQLNLSPPKIKNQKHKVAVPDNSSCRWMNRVDGWIRFIHEVEL